jgi:pimeloyl-ACP methyl ester carboxylesterase
MGFALPAYVSLLWAAEVFLPHITAGNPDWRSILLINNYAMAPTSFSLILFRDGETVRELQMEVPGQAAQQMVLADVHPEATCGRIVYSDPQLHFRLALENLASGGLTEFRLSADQASTAVFEFSNFASGLTWKGFALANLSTYDAQVAFFALGQSGLLATTSRLIRAQSRLKATHSDLFANLSLAEIEAIVAVSDYVPLSGLTLAGDATSSRLLFTQAASLDYFSSGNTCGNGLCEANETLTSCPLDCDPNACFSGDLEQVCLDKGWQRKDLVVAGQDRRLFFKLGVSSVPHLGSILLFHGGGGTATNFCGDHPLNVPVEQFCQLATASGFSLFSLDSSFNRARDGNGLSIGKRWDCLYQSRFNVDLGFVDQVLSEVVPLFHSQGEKVFLVGISNGGFMTALAASHFSERLAAFALVSAGDPYGTVFDMAVEGPRSCAPGVFRDVATGMTINLPGACGLSPYLQEFPWPPNGRAIPFKQFHHRGDGLCDVSCMEKLQHFLSAAGYINAGAYVVVGPRNVLHHFWRAEYNQPLLDFFKANAELP